MVQAAPVATPVPASAILRELRDLAITHFINVPDTHQRTLLSEMARQTEIRVLTACTEDEAISINAGLWIGGKRPILSIQHVGLLAAMNSVQGISLDARVPTCMLVGYFGRDVTQTVRDNRARAVPIIEPTLDTWGIPYFSLESPDDLPGIRTAYELSIEREGPTVVLVGAPTA
jgi:sulfopyruvate decarboxylase subunit alpha